MRANKYGVSDRKEYRRLWMKDFRRNNPEREKEYRETRRKKEEARRLELMELWRQGKLDYYPGRVREGR